jgi:hypothetical protein
MRSYKTCSETTYTAASRVLNVNLLKKKLFKFNFVRKDGLNGSRENLWVTGRLHGSWSNGSGRDSEF